MRSKLGRFMAVALISVMAFAVFTAEDCGGNDSGAQQRSNSVNYRNDTLAKANAKFPIQEVDPQNFPLRGALIEWAKWEDKIDVTWYLYVQSDFGNTIGYYTTKTPPISTCAFLSSTEDVRDDNDGNLILKAPSLDGMFYGGAGGSASCDSWFAFDAATNAPIISSNRVTVSPFPLKLDVEPVKFESAAPKGVTPDNFR